MMKKLTTKVLVIILCIMTMTCLVGCETITHNYTKEDDNPLTLFDQFVVIKTVMSSSDGILYDKDTKVEYYFTHSFGTSVMSPVYNSDGSIKIYNE